MKTNRYARAYLRVRGMVFCLGLLALVGVSFSVGASLAKKVVPVRAAEAQTQAPRLTVEELMWSAR